jgi:hypothetical protein
MPAPRLVDLDFAPLRVQSVDYIFGLVGDITQDRAEGEE